MAGLCDNCGKVSEKLHTCELCGARVGPECKREYGCKVCGGARKME